MKPLHLCGPWLILLATCSAALLPAGCVGPGAAGGQTNGGMIVWGAGPERHIFADSAAPEHDTPVFSRRARRIRLLSAINEIVDCQLVIASAGQALSGVRVEATPLRSGRHRIPRENIRLYRERFTPVRRYRSWFVLLTEDLVADRAYPDALVPLEARRFGQPFGVPPGRAQPIWVDIRVAKGTVPGRYRGRLKVQADGGLSRTVEIDLNVLDVALPDERHLPIVAALDEDIIFARHLRRGGKPYVPVTLSPEEPMRQEALDWLDKYVKLLHAHRVSPVIASITPFLDLTEGGRVKVLWDDYDNVVAKYLDGSGFDDRIPAARWAIPFNQRFPEPDLYGGLFSEQFEKTAVGYLRDCARHFRQKGWFRRHYIYLGPLSGPLPQQYRVLKRYGRLIRKADPELRLIAPMPMQSMDPLGWFGHYFEPLDDVASIYCPPAQMFRPQTAAQKRKLGKEVWWRDARPPFAGSAAIEAPLVHIRSWAWQAYQYQVDAIWLDGVCNWPADPFAAVIDRQEESSDDWIVYPGDAAGLKQALPSVRLKALRRGLQDYEYLYLLAQNGRGAIARAIDRTMVKFAHTDAYGDNFMDGRQYGWVYDPAQWQQARRLLLEELNDAIHNPDMAKPTGFRRDLAWAQFMTRNRRVRLEVDGVRCRATEAGPFEMVFYVTITNERSQPVSGMLRFAELPAWSKPLQDQIRIEQIPQGGTVHAQLSVRADIIQCGRMGTYDQPIVFETDQKERFRTHGRLAVVASVPLRKKLHLDGDLSEWPVQYGINTAGDFVLVSGEDFPKRNRPRGRALERTTVQVVHDEDYLYLGITCYEHEMSRMVVRTDNRLRYDGLLLWGEDLVEVMFDPTNAGTGNSHDIYHLVIKPTFGPMTCRGVRLDRPIGAQDHWSTNTLVFVKRYPDRWTIEARIPLSAFGDRARTRQIWGFNVARHEARLGESSSWSGARRYFYNPQSLGNLLVQFAPAAGP